MGGGGGGGADPPTPEFEAGGRTQLGQFIISKGGEGVARELQILNLMLLMWLIV